MTGKTAAAIVLVAISIYLILPAQAASNDYENVLLLSIDAQRQDRISAYGYQRKTSPNIDALIKKGIRFDNAYTVVPLTAPSFASVFMSRYPQETGLTRNGLSVRVKFAALAEILKKAGFVTGCVQSNWTIRGEESGLNAGFDYYEDSFKRMRSPVATERDAKYVTKFALDWVDKQKNKRFFLWTHYSDPHWPYVYRSNFDFPLLKNEMFLSPGYRYDTEVKYADNYIGELLKGLKSRGLLDKTLIVLIADHGESLGEHEYTGHGRQIYEPMLKIPMAIAGKGIPQGLVSRSFVQLIDVTPTILKILGLEIAPGSRGKPILDAELRSPSFGRESLFFETYRGLVPDLAGAETFMPGIKPQLLGMRQGNWKCIFAPETKIIELYDLSKDPREKTDISGLHADIKKDMVKKIVEWFDATGHYIPKDRQRVSEEERKKLESMGYVK